MTVASLTLDETFAQPATEERILRAAEALKANNFSAHVVDSAADARVLLHGLLPKDKEIFTANSETLRVSGIAADIDDGGSFRSVRSKLVGLEGDIRAQIASGAAPDVVVGSVHAVTESGLMLAASASGSQLGPYAAGAEKAFWIVGAQKIVADLDAALRRVRTYSLPREYERIYAATDGRFESFIGKILIMEREYLPDRSTVILVREEIGF
ncbi:LUD domain-containing protein [Tenggerimyces flavus]|uniref:LUD domain-containing protein n=1 Tax=Tenggerimyces flavus TaxID=1708749 RepID=A0ABV7YK77_9ACTN|nr:LUD domain-containing protein [Tenggerimyces flavus]MBM7783894.1 hypothetical protein [Tenggerimyces flavus]